MPSPTLHRNVTGQGQPVIILEAGIAATSLSWSRVQDELSRETTVLSYDRAGLGWSEATAAHDGTARSSAEDLKALLDETPYPPPYILVGHSYGGLVVRIFQQLYPEKVAGLVLVDPVRRAEWRNPTESKSQTLARGVKLSLRGAFLARLGVVRFALRLLTGGAQTIPRLLAKVTAGKGAQVTDRLAGEVRKMPQEHWPTIAEHWSLPRSFETMARNLENLPKSVSQLDETRSLGDLPITILSAAKPIPEHEADAALSTRGENLVIPHSGHWIQLDAPEAVIEAVKRMIKTL
jgi:pimeloyl-ACP methyl ester carboxylesterase